MSSLRGLEKTILNVFLFEWGGLVIAELPDPLLLEAEHGLSLVEEILQLGGEFTGKFH